MNFDGTVVSRDGGMICNECGYVISKGEDCIRVDHAKVVEGYDGPSTATQNFAGVYHTDCI